jgi:hypothetical protein
VFYLQSCTNPFAPAKADPDASSSNLLTEQRTPDEVLTNFKFAYTFKDSLVYSDLFDSSFVFRSMDFNEVPPVPIQWGRDLELKTAGRMFKFFNTLDLNFNSPIYVEEIRNDTIQNPPNLIVEKEIEMKLTFTLTLDGGSTIPTLNGEVIYVFFCLEKNDRQRCRIILWEDQQI